MASKAGKKTNEEVAGAISGGKKTPAHDITPDDMPPGFEEVTGGGRVDGWFTLEAGNSVQGTMGDSFEVKGKFGKKRVFRITLTSGATKITTGEGDPAVAMEGQTIGLDEKGFLKGLEDIEKGREIFVRCTGKDEPTKEYPRGAWKFRIGVVPF